MKTMTRVLAICLMLLGAGSVSAQEDVERLHLEAENLEEALLLLNQWVAARSELNQNYDEGLLEQWLSAHSEWVTSSPEMQQMLSDQYAGSVTPGLGLDNPYWASMALIGPMVRWGRSIPPAAVADWFTSAEVCVRFKLFEMEVELCIPPRD